MRAFTTTRRIRSGPRCSTECFNRLATAWPRPIRQHLPFRGRFPPLPRPPSPRICAAVSGPPFALAAAFRTCAIKDCERRPVWRLRSRMRPGRGWKSEASSRLMWMRLRPHGHNTSPNQRTLCHGVEKETKCGAANIAPKQTKQKNNVQTRPYRQTKDCFNLAIRTQQRVSVRPLHILLQMRDENKWGSFTTMEDLRWHLGPEKKRTILTGRNMLRPGTAVIRRLRNIAAVANFLVRLLSGGHAIW